MSAARKMSVEAWVAAGLEALERDGYRVVKADTLSKMLKVTRGSFYWHFPEVGSFHKAVIDRWTAETLEQFERELTADGAVVGEFTNILAQAFGTGAIRERQMRLWAVDEPLARAALATIDGRRLALLEKLAVERGLARDRASRRIKIVYWGYVGASVLEEPAGEDLSVYIEELALMLEPSVAKAQAPVKDLKVSPVAFDVAPDVQPEKAVEPEPVVVTENTKAAKPKVEKAKPAPKAKAAAKPLPDLPVQQALFDF